MNILNGHDSSCPNVCGDGVDFERLGVVERSSTFAINNYMRGGGDDKADTDKGFPSPEDPAASSFQASHDTSNAIMHHIQHQQEFYGAPDMAASTPGPDVALASASSSAISNINGDGVPALHSYADVPTPPSCLGASGLASSKPATIGIGGGPDDGSNVTVTSKKETSTSRPPSNGGKSENNNFIPSRPKVFHGKGSFPLNLTLLLESVEAMGLSHIVAWLPSGSSFVIQDPDQFLSVVLPKFFK